MTNGFSIRCACGHDYAHDAAHAGQTGHVLRGQDSAACYEAPAEEIEGFIQANLAGRRQEWVEQYYGQAGFDLHDANVVYDLLTRRHAQHLLRVYQCPECGRLAIERAPNSLSFRFFMPDGDDWNGTLASRVYVNPDLLGPVTFAEDKCSWWKALLRRLRNS